jgi:methionine biosynthesis protein metW|nr:class I SAM-dependent methyltransferase [uncultured Shuttleworthia sp.]
MKLSVKEYEAMQMGWRKWYIEKIELRQFKKYGLIIKDKDILEVGCGNGYCASLICKEGPRSYKGIDIMSEQLDQACSLELGQAEFIEASASDLSIFPDNSFDAVLDFCILHHVEGWRTFFDEAHRVL